jgi:hypothetical protein
MEDVLGIGIGYLAVGLPVLIVLIVFFFNYRESISKHDALIEMSKNINDPSQLKELIKTLEDKKDPLDYKRNGVVTIFVGIGLYLLGRFALGNILEGVGLLVLTIGVGMLIAGYLFPNDKLNNN